MFGNTWFPFVVNVPGVLVLYPIGTPKKWDWMLIKIKKEGSTVENYRMMEYKLALKNSKEYLDGLLNNLSEISNKIDEKS